MNAFITNLVRAIWGLWGIANYWTRWAIFIIVISPVAISVVALWGNIVATSIFALLPIVAITLIFLRYIDPLAVPVLETIPGVKDIVSAGIKGLRKFIAVELLMGVYFTFVPIHRRPDLLVPILLVMVALAALLTTDLKWGWASNILVAILIILTFLTFYSLKENDKVSGDTNERVGDVGVVPAIGRTTRNFLFGKPEPTPPTHDTTPPAASSTSTPTGHCQGPWEVRELEVPAGGLPVYVCWGWTSWADGPVTMTTPDGNVYHDRPGAEKTPVDIRNVTVIFRADPKESSRRVYVKNRW